MTLGDMIRDSKLARAMFGGRYGNEDPHVLAISMADELGYPQPGAEGDEGEAQRYAASRLAAQRLGPLPLITNPIHEGVLSWFAEGEGRPSMRRLMAGYRGALDALEAEPAPGVVREGYGLSTADAIKPAQREGTIEALLASVMAGR